MLGMSNIALSKTNPGTNPRRASEVPARLTVVTDATPADPVNLDFHSFFDYYVFGFGGPKSA